MTRYRSAWRWRCPRCDSCAWVRSGVGRWYCAACGFEWLPGRVPVDEVSEQMELTEVSE